MYQVSQDALYWRAKSVVQFFLPRLSNTRAQELAQLLAGERDTLSFYVPAADMQRMMAAFRGPLCA